MTLPKNRAAPSGRHSAGVRYVGDASSQGATWSRTLRETIESIAIAFMLAFLFRTFEAEAFVIPTGSMAPTLMGRHLDIVCPMCKFQYRVGALHDDEEDSQRAKPAANDPSMIDNCVCPNCGYALNLGTMTMAERSKYVYYNGDRILVSKFAYDFGSPNRWDVMVFKYPEDAKTNYIKRLIGLPGDVIRIRDGDISVSHDNGKTFAYAKRSPGQIRSMLQMVYDDDHAFRPFVERGWPAALQPVGSGATAWSAVANNSKDDYGPTAFLTTGKNAKGESIEAWLRYFHYAPDDHDWERFQRKGEQLSFVGADGVYPQPQPITDTNSYDTPFRNSLGANNPVDDLAMEFDVEVQQPQGKLAVELVKAGQPFRCVLDLSNGSVEAVIPGLQGPAPKADSGGIPRTGHHQIFFANVDHQFTLLVDDKKVEFNPPAVWSDVPKGTASAGSPVGIGSIGAALQVNHLRVMRDIYYTYDADRGRDDLVPPGWPANAQQWSCYPLKKADTLREAGADVRGYDQYFFLGANQFFALGDNTRLSQDGRFWSPLHVVDRRLLIGKALVIYWPHSFDQVSIFGHEVPLPFWPNFGRMGFVK